MNFACSRLLTILIDASKPEDFWCATQEYLLSEGVKRRSSQSSLNTALQFVLQRI